MSTGTTASSTSDNSAAVIPAPSGTAGNSGSSAQQIGTTVPASLASTGVPAGALALAGLGLLGAGTAAVLVTRRRRTTLGEDHHV
ncbi:LPXTG cell wall anchor domain-containing protein [Amycolatopsis cynarae]|uniref:LPXTG cell wall anchor domain-containing protein n=1 Tax=Amycolatopsis cynarae TaxID=2995223 RepID=A0ABY7BAV9_9PSEU|nr:LPXTG cell wall anchor domain-containing protein [Amycolatopsis sp. HUAS 11-8]WAL68362.1 LPXTG cell wall anchor domain-containing protein [Amycolatopsis sp. HUAS 11-8]